MDDQAPTHPCLTCGACCAHTRVTFHLRETTLRGGPVPYGTTEPTIPEHRAMKRSLGRCIALEGPLGTARCGIYARRPEVCRAFRAAWEDGAASPWCDAARNSHGLLPLSPEDWSVDSRNR